MVFMTLQRTSTTVNNWNLTKTMAMSPSTATWHYQLQPLATGDVLLQLTGEWRLLGGVPDIQPLLTQLNNYHAIHFDTQFIGSWDSSLTAFLLRLQNHCQLNGMVMSYQGLPSGVQRLLTLATTAYQRDDQSSNDRPDTLFNQVGESTLRLWYDAPQTLRFIGGSAIALFNTIRGRARFRREDLGLLMQDAGPRALPIVSLISFLVGMILAYMGASQLALFGAEIYIADLVGIGMVREVGALMTAIIIAGRTGASYAAEIGTMQVNEEIDALRTLGISPIEYLVLPRLITLIIMVPLLTLYADLVGILAGMVVAITAFNISIFEYYVQTLHVMDINHILVGLSKALVYGVCIAIAGCLRGIQCGRSAAAVGQATTSAVVTSIIYVVVTASVMTILYQKLGI